MAEMGAISRFFVNRLTGRRNERRFRWLRAHLVVPAQADCLEIGCGNGELAARFVEGWAPGRYVATDLDPRQVEVARRHLAGRFPAGVPSSLEVREADMLSLPFPPASFDAVLAFAVIHHASPDHHDTAKLPEALTEIDRVLRPGGTLTYEEFLHTAAIRTWLREHGYTLVAELRRRQWETVTVTKGAAPPAGSRPATSGP